MQIKEIRKTKYGYNVYIDEEKYNLEAFVFDKYNFKKGDIIKTSLWQQVLQENKLENIKRKSLVYLTTRRSTKEFITFLYKLEAPSSLIKELVKNYTDKGYLNDYFYAEAVIKKEFLRYGKKRLKQILINKGINNEIIDDLLKDHTDENLEQQIKKASLKVKAINYQKAKEKLLRSFLSKGYTQKEISFYLNQYLSKEMFNEEATIQKYYHEYLRKYGKKHSGKELDLKIKQALYKKGFKKETIEKIIRGE